MSHHNETEPVYQLIIDLESLGLIEWVDGIPRQRLTKYMESHPWRQDRDAVTTHVLGAILRYILNRESGMKRPKGGPVMPKKTGNFPEKMVGDGVPPKPAHQGYTKQSGEKAYKDGSMPGTVKNK